MLIKPRHHHILGAYMFVKKFVVILSLDGMSYYYENNFKSSVVNI